MMRVFFIEWRLPLAPAACKRSTKQTCERHRCVRCGQGHTGNTYANSSAGEVRLSHNSQVILSLSSSRPPPPTHTHRYKRLSSK
eukprot:365523-Chlamydomonas_euryale.AAC.2